MPSAPRLVLAVALVGVLAVYAASALADEVPLSAVPPAVRATIERELGDGWVKEIERKTRDGRTLYEVEFVRDGREHEIKLAEDGTVLERERD